MPPKFNESSFSFPEGSEVPEHIEGYPQGGDPAKYRLEGHDTFEGSNYPLAVDIDDLDTANLLHQARLIHLEETQPTHQSGGQAMGGIQDRVYIIPPAE